MDVAAVPSAGGQLRVLQMALLVCLKRVSSQMWQREHNFTTQPAALPRPFTWLPLLELSGAAVLVCNQLQQLDSSPTPAFAHYTAMLTQLHKTVQCMDGMEAAFRGSLLPRILQFLHQHGVDKCALTMDALHELVDADGSGADAVEQHQAVEGFLSTPVLVGQLFMDGRAVTLDRARR